MPLQIDFFKYLNNLFISDQYDNFSSSLGSKIG